VIPKRDEQLLKQFLLKLTREELLRDNPSLTQAQQIELNELCARAAADEPIAKIIGKKSFWKHDFITSSNTLDPRPETELIIEAVLALRPSESPLKILDLGTGTGCLLLSLLHEYPNASGVGVDISADALAIAQQNLQNMPENLKKRTNFINLSWTNVYNVLYDIIVTNPPYIPTCDINLLEKAVRDFDPTIALDGGEDGLNAYKEIFAISPSLLKKNGLIICEIGINQHNDVINIANNHRFSLLNQAADLAGTIRVLSFERII
jgi:release factor glutamine methyltransferase